MYLLSVGQHLNFMIIGSIMPGAGSGVYQRHTDIADGDYISGSVRMLDAAGIFCIAMGVGLVFSLFRGLTGGVML